MIKCRDTISVRVHSMEARSAFGWQIGYMVQW